MKCRHCLVEFHDHPDKAMVGQDTGGPLYIVSRLCPACKQLNLAHARRAGTEVFFYPRSVSREPLGAEIPTKFSADYIEACNVLDISPKASAALSRRCLQLILREKAGITRPNLDLEIKAVLESGKLPGHIADSLDAIRTVGNFAAHPIKTTSSGEIVDVEPGEAEWNLDTLEALFDFYFVQPEKIAKKRTALNAKLAEAGKPPLK